ncbi:DEAD/DEAH box helicase [Amycolatopsis thailandensis]|uniref:DEAD/DEAH box helicase n=1 Tax=Amycolatopsis thailandensis TaxID=589330 RepID=UPI003633746D
MQDREQSARVVQFWRTIEMFMPQGVPKLTPAGERQRSTQVVLDIARNEPAPWQAPHPIARRQPREGKTWQFTVYGGLYSVAAARAALTTAFGEDNVPADARGNDGETALFAFTLDAEGCLVENSATLSACAWAISRLASPGPDDHTWLDGFAHHEREFVAALNKLVPPKREPRSTGNGVVKSALTTAGRAITEQAKGAAKEAVTAGAKATGAAVTTAVGAGVSAVAGPVVGGIAGAVAGTFAEKLLTPRDSDSPPKNEGDAADRPAGHSETGITVPRLRMTAAALNTFVSEMASALGVADVLDAHGVRVACTQVPETKADQAGGQNFLNSYIAADLAEIEDAVRSGNVGAGLATYLADHPAADRIDVRAGRDPLIHGVQPRYIPGGRWPTAVSRPLVISQQFAVNQIMSELGDNTGLFAVNGPPGTGKTTMLRDVLAAIVVERATRLAALQNPRDAFTEVTERVALGPRYTAAVRGLRAELTGFEVVVATASNDAAANVTAEIPAMDAVRGAEDEALAVDYFTDLASHVLGSPAWGMVAAALGNMKNRNSFAGRFWWGDGARQTSDEAGRQNADDEADTDELNDESGNVGLLNLMKQVRADPDIVEDWDTAVTAFTDAQAEVQRLAAARQIAAEAITEFNSRRTAVREAEGRLRQSQAACEQLNNDLRHATEQCHRAEHSYRKANEEYEDWPNHRPGCWVSLSTGFRAGKEWDTQHGKLRKARDNAKTTLAQWTEFVPKCKSALNEAVLQNRRNENALNDATYALAAVQARIDAARAEWPTTVPFGDELADEAQFQLCAPWADPEFTTARNQLFLAALRLHKTFLLSAEPHARGNLAVIAAVIGGTLKNQPKPQTLLAAWQALFLVVPMISTTFASLPRLFSGLGSESFGWLFIDEAGQATPQQAVGGLWRCRRAVIVGDPQQLEPIVTLPLPAQHALRRHHDVHEQWTPENTSAQRVADRHARHGTALPEPDGGTVWVGAPLRVHRRCDRPMFEISNTIAYGGDLMIYGTNHDGDYPGQNTWIDVRSGQSHGNWIPAEGEALLQLLTDLARDGVKTHEIRVISPFRDVVRGSKDILTERLGRDDHIRGFVHKNVGTVHTVQGQEANVVILVLGSKPNSTGARAWAAEKPNLLNVAASRAKRRLYIIGNHDNWKHLRYFNFLATTMPADRQ